MWPGTFEDQGKVHMASFFGLIAFSTLIAAYVLSIVFASQVSSDTRA